MYLVGGCLLCFVAILLTIIFRVFDVAGPPSFVVVWLFGSGGPAKVVGSFVKNPQIHPTAHTDSADYALWVRVRRSTAKQIPKQLHHRQVQQVVVAKHYRWSLRCKGSPSSTLLMAKAQSSWSDPECLHLGCRQTRNLGRPPV